MLNIPLTKNIISLQVYDKKGNLLREKKAQNLLTEVGVNNRLHLNNALLTSGNTGGTTTSVYKTGLIDVGTGISNQSSAARFNALTITGEDAPLLYLNPPTVGSIGGPKLSLANGVCEILLDYEYEGSTVIGNRYTWDFGYGTVNFTINKIVTSSSTGSNILIGAGALLDDGFTVTNEERLIVEYTHIFNAYDYYDLVGNNLVLKEQFKNITLTTGSFILEGQTIPYNVIIRHLYDHTVPINSNNNTISWALALWQSATGSKEHTIYYGENQTVLYVMDGGNSYYWEANEDKTQITREINVKFPPTVPELSNISAISITNRPSGSQFQNVANPLQIQFPEPWDKPADTEFEVKIKWTEQISQQ